MPAPGVAQKGRDPDSNNTGGCRYGHATYGVSLFTLTRSGVSPEALRTGAWSRHGPTPAGGAAVSAPAGRALTAAAKAIPFGCRLIGARRTGAQTDGRRRLWAGRRD